LKNGAILLLTTSGSQAQAQGLSTQTPAALLATTVRCRKLRGKTAAPKQRKENMEKIIHFVGDEPFIKLCGRHVLNFSHWEFWTDKKKDVTCLKCIGIIKRRGRQKAAPQHPATNGMAARRGNAK
jgi:hypothetical protein